MEAMSLETPASSGDPVIRPSAPPRVWTVIGAYGIAILCAGGGQLALLILMLLRRLSAQPGSLQDVQVVAAMTRELVRSPEYLLGAMLLSSAILAAVALMAARMSPEPIAARLALGGSRMSPGMMAIAVCGGVATSSVFDALFGALGRAPGGSLARLNGLVETATGSQFVLLLVFAGLAAPVAEELLFRGYVQSRLCARWGPWKGVAASAALFALIHFDWTHSPAAFVMGLYLGWLAQRSGSVRPSIAAHAVNNSVWATATHLGLGAHVSQGTNAALLISYVAFTAWAVVWLTGKFRKTADATG